MDVEDIDSDLDYFLAVATNLRHVISPYVVHIQRPSLPDLLVVARLENLPVRIRLAYRTVASITLRAIVVTFDGVLGARGPEDEKLAMASLRELMEGGAAELILMRNVDPLSSLHAAATRPVARLRLARNLPPDRLWEAEIPQSMDAFLAGRSSKSRSSFRREDRLLQKEFGETLKVRRFRSIDEMDELCRDMEAVSSLTYQHGLGAGFTNSPMQRALISLGMEKGRYCCWMLYAEGRPVAFWSGTAHNGTFFVNTPGFDPALARHSVGRYTMFRMIEDLCADPTISRMDLGRGDAQYKAEYGKVRGDATDIWVAARHLRPIMAVNALSLAGAANSRARRWIINLQVDRRIRTLWRRRLANRPGKSPV
jgi:CelD/BcsL family acetyltransferase involved in cellulose biosynthesis